jgi:hypothetical protein
MASDDESFEPNHYYVQQAADVARDLLHQMESVLRDWHFSHFDFVVSPPRESGEFGFKIQDVLVQAND